MSRQERARMAIMAGVQRGELTQVQAGELLGLGYRQTKRVPARFKVQELQREHRIFYALVHTSASVG